jgi:signal recognition particle subunit SRP72
VQTKLWLLLQTEQYQPALSLIEHEGNNQDRAFERSYSLYRLQREEEARQILTTIKDELGDDDRGVMHLEAQLVRIFFLYWGPKLTRSPVLSRRIVPGGC